MKVICDLSTTSAANRARSGWTPGALFRNGEKGGWFDPSTLSSLYQSAAGQDRISQPGSPVGRMEDKSGQQLHAGQSGFARPIYCLTPASGHRNLTSISEPTLTELSNGTGVTDAAVPIDGFEHAIQVPGGTASTRIAYLVDGAGPLTEYTLSCFVAMDDGDAPVPGSDFSIAIGNLSSGDGWAMPVEMGQGVWRVSRTLTSSDSNLQNTGILKTAAHSGRGFRVTGFQVDAAPAMTAYQRARSAFDLSESGVPSLAALDFDGVDDCMFTGTLDLSQSSQVTVIAGVVKHSNPATRGTVVNFVDNGYRSFGLEVPMPGNDQTRWLHAGQTALRSISYPFGIGERAVMSGLSDLQAPRLVFRQNGVVIQEDNSVTGGGTFKTGALGIGDYVLPGGRRLHGRLFGLLVIDRFLEPDEIAQAENWIGKKTGVFL